MNSISIGMIVFIFLCKILTILVNIRMIFFKLLTIYLQSILKTLSIYIRNLLFWRKSVLQILRLMASFIIRIVNYWQILLRRRLGYLYSLSLRYWSVVRRIHLTLTCLSIKYLQGLVRFFNIRVHRNPIVRIVLLGRLVIRNISDFLLRGWEIYLLSIHLLLRFEIQQLISSELNGSSIQLKSLISCMGMFWGDFIQNNFYNCTELIEMATERSLKGFAVTVLIMQIFFAIIYAFQEGYAKSVSYSDFNGLIATVFLCMLLLVGFGLITVYIKQFAITGLILNFIMLSFTIQWYFLLKKLWYAIQLTDTLNSVGLGDNPHNIRLSGILKYSYSDPSFAVDVRDMKYFTLSQAICCAISMYVILFPLFGRVGPSEAIAICFIGNIGYTLNEAAFWRLNISDNGYGMKIFLFGAIAGIIASLIVGRSISKEHQSYISTYEYQTLSLIGSIFVWILLPWLSYIDQSQTDSTTFVNDFRQIAPLNIFYALSASASSSFSTSVWLRGKIAVHDIIFSCFTGAIAYGSSSNVFPNPWPAMLVGTLAGISTTYFNSKKKILNQNGVVDSLGGIFVFLIPSLAGAIYSSILFATTAYGPFNDLTYVQADGGRSRWAHGAYQLVGIAITFGTAALSGLMIGGLMKIFSSPYVRDDLFNDNVFIEKDGKKVLQQTKIIKVQ